MENKDILKLELTVGEKVFPMTVKVGKSLISFNEDVLDAFETLVREVIAVRKFNTRYDNLEPEQMDEVEEALDKASDGKED